MFSSVLDRGLYTAAHSVAHQNDCRSSTGNGTYGSPCSHAFRSRVDMNSGVPLRTSVSALRSERVRWIVTYKDTAVVTRREVRREIRGHVSVADDRLAERGQIELSKSVLKFLSVLDNRAAFFVVVHLVQETQPEVGVRR